MAYLPNVRIRVDWDNDSFLNGVLPSGTAPNLIPNAAYVAGIKAAHVIGIDRINSGELKEIDDIGFTCYNADFNTIDKFVGGVNILENYSEVPVGEDDNLVELSDYMLSGSHFLVDEPSKPHEFDVYEHIISDTDLFTGSIVLPAGFYRTQLWLRSKNISGFTTTTISLQGEITGSVFRTDTDTVNWTDWSRIVALYEVTDDGSGFGTLDFSLACGTALEYRVQFGGFMIMPERWVTVNTDNRTVVYNSGSTTLNWNAGTGQYDMVMTGSGSRAAAFELINAIPRYAWLFRLDGTLTRTGSIGTFSIASSNTAVSLGTAGSASLSTTPVNFSYYGSVRQNQDFFADPQDIDLLFSYNPTSNATVNIDITNFEYLDLPDQFWARKNKPKIVATDVVMENGNAYNFSFYAQHDGVGSQNIDLTIYGVSNVDGTLTVLETATVAITTVRSRFVFEISTLADDYSLYFEITSASTDTFTFKGFQLTLGANPHAFNVGSYAALDNITSYVKSAQWKSGRNKFDDDMAYEGTLDLTLDNTGKEFSIENVLSPYYGLLRQNLKIVFEIEHDFVWYPLWSGWTRFFEIVAGTNSSMEVSLHAEQGIYRLREGSFSYAPTEDTRMDDVVKTIVHNSGWRSARSPFHTILSFDAVLGINTYLQASDEIFSRIDVGKQSLSLVGMDWGRETTPDRALQQVLEAEQGKLWVDRDGGLVLVNRNHLINAKDKFVTDLTLDTEVQDASYNFGEGIVNRIQVLYEEKKEVVRGVVWQSKSPIYVPPRNDANIYGTSTVRIPLHFTFEEQRQKTITKLYTRIPDYDIVVRNAITKVEITDWRRKLWPAVTSDGGNRIELQLRNDVYVPLEVDFTLYGDYLEGGQSQTVIVEDKEAQEYIQAIHEKIIKTSVLSDLDTATNLAKWDLSRYAEPRGEFRVIQTYVDSPAILQRLLSWDLGTILKISEVQTGEVDRYHIIIAEEGSYGAGDTVRITHRMSRGDDNYYNKVGYSTARKGTLNHSPKEDILEADMFGSDGGSADIVSYLHTNGDTAMRLNSNKWGGAVFFGNKDALSQHYVTRLTPHFARYGATTTTDLNNAGITRPFLNKSYAATGVSVGGNFFGFAFVNSYKTTGASNWRMLPKAEGALTRYSATILGNLTDSVGIEWDADSTNNLATGTTGAITKTQSVTYSGTNSGTSPDETLRHKVVDFIVKAPSGSNTGMYARFGGTDILLKYTDPVEVNMNKLQNTALKENTLYYVTLWAGANLGESADIEVVIIEHDTATEHVLPLTISEYGKYQDTFTTSAALTDTMVSVFFRINGVDTPVYATGFAITEQDVDTIAAANVRQELAAYVFV